MIGGDSARRASTPTAPRSPWCRRRRPRGAWSRRRSAAHRAVLGLVEAGLPYLRGAHPSTPGVSTVVAHRSPRRGRGRAASFSSFTSGDSSTRCGLAPCSCIAPHRRARLRLESVTTSTESGLGRPWRAARPVVRVRRRVEDHAAGPRAADAGEVDEPLAVARHDDRCGGLRRGRWAGASAPEHAHRWRRLRRSARGRRAASRRPASAAGRAEARCRSGCGASSPSGTGW